MSNKPLLDDVVVVIGIEIGLEKAILQIHLIEYLPQAWIIVDLQSVDGGAGQNQQGEQKYFHSESIDTRIRKTTCFYTVEWC